MKNLEIWDQKCFIWVFFGLEFKKSAIIEINVLELVEVQNFVPKENAEIWDQKSLIWIFWGCNLKILYHN